jgi:hypothetical protein
MASSTTPIRIGYCLSLTGPVAGNSRSARLAHDIWREDVNRCGGLLGRPVELICYDDHANASLVPGIYKRLMDEDKIDLVIGGYGTNTVLPAMPLIMERRYIGEPAQIQEVIDDANRAISSGAANKNIEPVDNLGAYSIPSETGLLIPSGFDSQTEAILAF